MVESVLAGIVISFGTIAHIWCGSEVMGAVFFAITVLSVVYFDLDLFIGKLGLLTARSFDAIELFFVLIGNCIGVFWVAMLVRLITPEYGYIIINKCKALFAARNRYRADTNFILSLFCGMIMYAGITAYQKTKIYVMLMIPVMMCVMCGFQYYLSDMFCYWMVDWKHGWMIIPTFIGNVIGANLFPLLRKRSKRFHDEFNSTSPEEIGRRRFVESILVRHLHNKDNRSRK